MKTNIKQQFSDLRKNTPKHVQWLLLAAAFIVVVILLLLLLGGKNDSKQAATPEDIAVKLIFTPDEQSIDWADTKVGEKRTQTIKISASAPAKIMAVRRNKDVPGLAAPQQTCTAISEINSKTSCTITLEYAPKAAQTAEGAPLYIDWRGTREPDSMKRTATITLVLGATGVQEPEKPKPVVVPEPKPEPVVEPVAEPVVETPKPVKQEIKKEIESLVPSNPFEETAVKPEAPVAMPPTPSVPAKETVAESCSDFAFPGYNLSGKQIGWIKPERGAYYFHPFSDKKCDTPTGVYNPDNGIITDINDNAKKIGTDAEHIGYATITNGTLPQLSNPVTKQENKARQINDVSMLMPGHGMAKVALTPAPVEVSYQSSGGTIINTVAYDRSFILRQYKPIPATIVSDVRADPESLANNTLPVRATVDRNVYADNGRTVIIPAGTLLMGYVSGKLPGPYTAIGRMEIKWYQFILPNGVEFNFPSPEQDPFSADAQGRTGVPGRGSTDYMEQFIMPMLTAIVPAAVNMIAPVADKFVNQIDLDNNTVVQSGTVRSSELAKNEIITAWNQVAQKLLVDMMDNTVPPFSIPAGTRITVYSPMDLQVTCGDPNDPANAGKKCAIKEYSANPRRNATNTALPDYSDGSWTGQVRSFNLTGYCQQDSKGIWAIKQNQEAAIAAAGYDYRTVLFYCQSLNYQAINNAKQDALFQNQQQQFQSNYQVTQTGTGLTGMAGDQKYNEEVLGLKYNEETGAIQNPFQKAADEEKEEATALITCEDGTNPDANGCCTGEIYTDMGEQGFNCCPETGGDCFPPIVY